MASIMSSKNRVATSKRITPTVTISDNSSEMFAVRWSPDGNYIAAGAGDGNICVFAADTGTVAYELQQGSAAALPATSLRFRPSNDTTRTKNVLVSTNAVGAIQHWHVTSGKCLHTIEEKDNQVFALDYQRDGLVFATAGKEPVIRLYDEATKAETCLMKGTAGYSSTQSSGHSNRIFSLKFSPDDDHILASGGWDNTVHFWDTRSGQSIRSIYGPHLCGDGLDMCSNGTASTTVLTGSWRPQSPLEMWDFGTGKIIEQVEWKDSILGSSPCMLYAAQFSKADGGRFIAAGGSGTNEARVFDRFGDHNGIAFFFENYVYVFVLSLLSGRGCLLVCASICSIILCSCYHITFILLSPILSFI
mmetsp:Transcript_13885/g.17995  ORF Transcript_13885/g.17995 Transcript_13885/m.17995 type:complete len:361 (+) Transcript_13885:82-1164(+)